MGDGANRDPVTELGRQIAERIKDRAAEAGFTVVMSSSTWLYLCISEGWNPERRAFSIHADTMYPFLFYEHLVSLVLDDDVAFSDYILSSRLWFPIKSMDEILLDEPSPQTFTGIVTKELAKELFEDVKSRLRARDRAERNRIMRSLLDTS